MESILYRALNAIHDCIIFTTMNPTLTMTQSIRSLPPASICRDRNQLQYRDWVQTHYQLKSFNNLIIHSFFLNPWILLKFCTEHGSHTAVLCAKFQKDSWTVINVIGSGDIAKFHNKTDFRWITHIVTDHAIYIIVFLMGCSCHLLHDR